MNIARIGKMLAFAFLLTGTVRAQDMQSYLPLSDNAKWVLRNPGNNAEFVFEILRRDGDGYYMRSVNPFGTSDWVLSEKNGVFVMTKFGANDKTMPFTDNPVFLDFNKPAGAKWSSKSLGNVQVVSRSVTVRGPNATYTDCIQIRHSPPGANNLYTFAKGVGFVQFAEGPNAFVLDESASNLPGRSRSANSPPRRDREPGPGPAPRPSAVNAPQRGGVLIGLTPNNFANEPRESMVQRFQQTVDAGVSFVVGNSTWSELEPKPGQYNMGNVNYLVSSAKAKNLPLSYTLRIIDTINPTVPDDLKRAGWNSQQMKDRVVKLIDAMAPAFQGQVRWFMFGYESDGYFDNHAREVRDFAALYDVAAARMKQLVPGIKVGSTLAYSTSIDKLNGSLAPLSDKLDFLSFTYIPFEPGFKVKDPSVLPSDFDRMKAAAKGRKIVLQELAYSTASITGGSEDKQAEFYRLAFEQLSKDKGANFDAANVMMLADLSDKDAQGFATFFKLGSDQTFKAALQTIGLFDTRGRPKKAWDVFRQHVPLK
jgi:hypothetical protein